jgi:hypothetical protein
MDCIHARLLIVLQGRDAKELDAQAVAGLEQHLEQCADCLAWSSQESRVDETLAKAIQKVPVPADLPSKILHHLEHQPRPRCHARWLSAAAACVLIGAGVAGYLAYTDKAELTVAHFEQLVSHFENATPGDIEELFANAGMAVQVPLDLNFDHFSNHGVTTIRGLRIPRLDYVARRSDGEALAVAHVYVLAENAFQLDVIRKAIDDKGEPIVTSSHKIEARQFEAHPGFVYVIVYTGRSLHPFFTPRVVRI